LEVPISVFFGSVTFPFFLLDPTPFSRWPSDVFLATFLRFFFFFSPSIFCPGRSFFLTEIYLFTFSSKSGSRIFHPPFIRSPLFSVFSLLGTFSSSPPRCSVLFQNRTFDGFPFLSLFCKIFPSQLLDPVSRWKSFPRSFFFFTACLFLST